MNSEISKISEFCVWEEACEGASVRSCPLQKTPEVSKTSEVCCVAAHLTPFPFSSSNEILFKPDRSLRFSSILS